MGGKPSQHLHRPRGEHFPQSESEEAPFSPRNLVPLSSGSIVQWVGTITRRPTGMMRGAAFWMEFSSCPRWHGDPLNLAHDLAPNLSYNWLAVRACSSCVGKCTVYAIMRLERVLVCFRTRPYHPSIACEGNFRHPFTVW